MDRESYLPLLMWIQWSTEYVAPSTILANPYKHNSTAPFRRGVERPQPKGAASAFRMVRIFEGLYGNTVYCRRDRGGSQNLSRSAVDAGGERIPRIRRARRQRHAKQARDMYARGQLVAQDDVQAVFWWRKAAEQGHAEAEYNLADMYFMGRGVTQDDSRALQWFRKAAEQGYADAENALANMYASGRGVSKDDALALEWFRRAAEQGNATAQNNLGIGYALGRGTARDDAVAVEWFRKAANLGSAAAQNNLGTMYQQVEHCRKTMGWRCSGSAGQLSRVMPLRNIMLD